MPFSCLWRQALDTDAGRAPTQPLRTHLLALVAAIAAGVIGGCAFAKMSPALPLLKTELGLTLMRPAEL